MCTYVGVYFLFLLSHDYRWLKIEAYLKLNLSSFQYVRLVDDVCVCAYVCAYVCVHTCVCECVEGKSDRMSTLLVRVFTETLKHHRL